jgi:hypothetical protein
VAISSGPSGSATIAPTISGSDALNTIIANVASQITITGNALTGASLELTSVSGDVIVIAADASDTTSLTATINVPVGVYAMKAVSADEISGTVVLIVKPETNVSITSIETACGACEGTVTITGSGFGPEIPASVQSVMNVMQDNVVLTIVSWTDTQIVATGEMVCDGGAITVNGLHGSATK